MSDRGSESKQNKDITRRTLMQSSAAVGLLGVTTGAASATDETITSSDPPEEVAIQEVTVREADAAEASALLLKDCEPWEEPANEMVLDDLQLSYDLITSSEFSEYLPSLSGYDFVIITSTQNSEYYQQLNNYRDSVLEYVENGGTLVAHMTPTGWPCNGAWPTRFLPDGIEINDISSNELTIVSDDHGVTSDLTNEDLYGWSSSTHGNFENVPAETDVIVGKSDNPTDLPTYIEHTYGSGRIVATLQTIEWPFGETGQGDEQLLYNELEYVTDLDDGQDDGDEEEGPVEATFTPDEAVAGETVDLQLTVDAEEPISGITMGFDDTFESVEILDPGSEAAITETDLIVYEEPLPENITATYEVAVPAEILEGDELTINGEVGLSGKDEVISIGPHVVTITDEEIPPFEATLTADDQVIPGGTWGIEIEAATDAGVSTILTDVAETVGLSIIDPGAETFISDPDLIVYDDPLPQEVVAVLEGEIPEDAEVGETFEVSVEVTDSNEEVVSLGPKTATVSDDPLDKYRDDNGEIGNRGLITAISDWRNGDLGDRTLIEVIGKWRDARGAAQDINAVLSQL